MSDSKPKIFTFTFLRHGESVGNRENRHQGHADFPLTERGRLQTKALVKRWQTEGRTFDRALSSPLLRARETAEIICSGLQVPLEFDPDLMEINNGMLAGQKDEDIGDLLIPLEKITGYTHYGKTGESRWELFLRGGRVIQRLVDSPPGRVLVVTHGGILNMMLYAILGIPVQHSYTGPRFLFNNTSFATFTYEPVRHIWRMLVFEDPSIWKED